MGIVSSSSPKIYQQPWFSKSTAYDSDDRIIEGSTGASSPELLDTSGSWVHNTYSARGTLVSVTSSYGELIRAIHRSADGLIEQIDHGDAANTSTVQEYDERRFLTNFSVQRAIPPLWSSPPATYQPPPDPTSRQMLLRDEAITRDLVGNPISIQDYRIDAEWPAGAKPVARDIQYDDLYRVIQVDYNYTGGSDAWVSPHAPELAGSTDPRRPSDVPSQIVRPTRIQQQRFTYDWLGNLSRSSDDLNTLWDRSMGAMRTWTDTSMPYRFRDAGNRADSTWPGGDWADAPTYDETGNIGQIRVTRTATCTNGGTACSHTYSYYYDEVGRLYRALRHEGTPQKAELRFIYDANDDRVIKSDVFPAGTVDDRHTLYIFDSLELRRAPHDATNLRYTVNSQTEVPYLNANGVRLGRVVYESPADGEPRLSGNPLHVFLNLGDELGSTSIIIDQDTGELVERMTYQPYGATESDYRPGRWKGFREDYRFTGKEEDQEVGLTYFGKRFLVARLGRWVSPDPLAVHAPGSADLNLYAYVHGRVLRAVDPIGLEDAPAKEDAKAQKDFFSRTHEQRQAWQARERPKGIAGDGTGVPERAAAQSADAGTKKGPAPAAPSPAAPDRPANTIAQTLLAAAAFANMDSVQLNSGSADGVPNGACNSCSGGLGAQLLYLADTVGLVGHAIGTVVATVVEHGLKIAGPVLGAAMHRIIEHGSEAAAKRAALKEAGIPAGTPPTRSVPSHPGSRSPMGPPGERLEWDPISDANVGAHHDPYGHLFPEGDTIPLHFGVDIPGQGTTHHTYPTGHDPKTNR